MIGVVRDVTIVWSRGGWNIELQGATIDRRTIARGEQKVTLMASTENLPEAKPTPPAEPGAADEDTEGHAWMNDNETVVVDDDTEGHRLASNDDETVVEDDRD